MQRKLFILMSKDGVEPYFNLKNLTDNNPHIPYTKVYRGLLKSKSYITDTYSIFQCTAKYKTNRGNKT